MVNDTNPNVNNASGNGANNVSNAAADTVKAEQMTNTVEKAKTAAILGAKAYKRKKDKDKKSKSGEHSNGDTGEKDTTLKDLKKAKKAVKTGMGAGEAAVKAGMFSKIIMGAKMLFSTLSNIATAAVSGIGSFFSMIWGFIQSGASAVASFFSGIGSAIGNFFSGVAGFIGGFFGIGATASAVATGGVTISTAALMAAMASVITSTVSMISIRDSSLVDCSETVYSVVSYEDIDADSQLLSNARDVYSVLSYLGYSDEQIAGVLGNWTVESSIDPTSIEGILDEKYNISGPKHQEAMADWDAYVKGTLSDAYGDYAGGGPVVNPSNYTASDGNMYPGLGMGQYTGGSAMKFLAIAEAGGYAWYTMEYQIAYTLAFGAPASGSGFWDTYITLTGTASDMASYFAIYWEGNSYESQEKRKESAESWLSVIATWTSDNTYAEKVLTMMSSLNESATYNNVSRAKSNCVRTIDADNSSIASAAVAYAYETKAEGIGNDGTDLYILVHDAVWEGDTIYQSCDRGVATAIRWSGSDDTYPIGAAPDQLAYLKSSSKWRLVGMASELTMDDLLPGDIFIISDHTFIYVGNDAVISVYPDSDGDSVSASYEERSPGIGTDATEIIEELNGQDWEGRGEYYVYRCVNPDNSSTYTSAASDYAG